MEQEPRLPIPSSQGLTRPVEGSLSGPRPADSMLEEVVVERALPGMRQDVQPPADAGDLESAQFRTEHDEGEKSASGSKPLDPDSDEDENDKAETSVTRRTLIFDILKTGKIESQDKLNACYDAISNDLKSDLTLNEIVAVKKEIASFRSKYKTRLNRCHKKLDKVANKYTDWIDKKFSISKIFLKSETESPAEVTAPPSRTPSLTWEEQSRWQKRRKVEDILDRPSEHLLLASQMSLRKEGQTTYAKLLKVANISPNRPGKILRAIQTQRQEIRNYTPEEALAQLLDNGLSVRSYIDMRQDDMDHGITVKPSYDLVSIAKKACRPDSAVLQVTELKACVPLQSLLEHTATRLAELQEDVIKQKHGERGVINTNCTFICTWGFDGSSGQSNYKQRFMSNIPDPLQTDKTFDDSSLFATTVIPLRLVSENGDLYWNNSTPQSIRFCRPLRLQFIKESKDVILSEKKSVEEEILALENLEINIGDGHKIVVTFQLHLTVIDGKVLAAITNTPSSQVCPLCKAPPSSFNQLANVEQRFQPIAGNLQYGISPLHAWIRLFEFCLHLSYKLEIKKWQARLNDKPIVMEKKQKIQLWMREAMGLIVDMPKHNQGTSNDGNTARRAFEHYVLFSSILGIDEEFVKGLRILLIAMSSQLPLDPEKFEAFCKKVRERYVSLYNWFYMPVTAHKILVHGADIIRASALPLGMMGEDAAESRNKLYRSDRLFHARKTSRIANMSDVFNRAMDTSDPVISSISLKKRLGKRNRKMLPREVVDMLEAPQLAFTPTQLEFEEETNAEPSTPTYILENSLIREQHDFESEELLDV